MTPSFWSRVPRRLNVSLLLGMAALIVIGVAFIYSACSIREDVKLRESYRLQASAAMLGLVLYLALASINYRALVRWSWLFYLGCLVLLGAVLVMGEVTMGAQRRVFSLQPSELAKLAVVLIVAWFLGRREAPRGLGAYFATLGLLALPAGLALLQPDLGTALVFVPTVFAMLFVAGVAPRAFWLTLGCGALAAIWVVSVVVAVETTAFAPRTETLLRRATGLTRYQQDRIAHFIYPELDARNGGWNKRQSEIAVGSGGLWGKGFRKGDQNMLGYLPKKVSSTDFIFSVLAEEAGFAGALVVVTLFALVIGIVMTVALTCPDGVGKLLCVGVGTMMFCHVFVNIAMTVGLLPITGIPLPFISWGRTCLLTMMAALGFVQSVAIHGRQAASRF